MAMFVCFFFFFFQAEDGIRDLYVTGVQTCALPISPEDVTPSPWADRVEEWAVGNLLVLANEPGEITRKGAGLDRDSTIDLTWYNDAAIEGSIFTNWELDWAGSLGSDHALTRVQGLLPQPPQFLDEDSRDLGYVLDEEKESDWCRLFKIAVGSPARLPTR